MKRRATVSSKASKKGPKPKRRIAGATNHARPSNADLQKQLDLTTAELTEARKLLAESLEQHTATSQVLKVISSSPGDLKPVFEAILKNATRICKAHFGTMFLREHDELRAVATHNVPPRLAEIRRGRPNQPDPKTGLGLAMTTKAVVHVHDLAAEKGYRDRHPHVVDSVELGGIRTLLVVPMIKDGEVIGAFGIFRQEVLPFTKKQIELLINFAAQAVIAIENARLLKELRQRTDDLTESLEQQTATSEVLKVISSSPGELAPVFRAMMENGVRICEAEFGNLTLLEGDTFRHVALHGGPTAYVEAIERDPSFRPIHADHPLNRLIRTKDVVHIANMSEEPALQHGRLSKLAGARTLLIVPMLKEDRLIGSLNIYRQEMRPFSDKQIDLLRNFAAQAVIAIENARLLNELRQRTEDLSESLEQQTATSEVLRVISSSPGELEPVFSAMLENAVHICDASFGNLLLYEGNVFRHVALYNAPDGWAAERDRDPIPPRDTARVLYAVAETKLLAHVADIKEENPDEPIGVIAGARTLLIVPMLKDRELLGAIAIYRQEVRPFNDKQVQLLQNFAAQAVIAIENTRLLNELRQRTDDLTESLEQQTATSEVLKVISSSPGDLESVFQAMLENATRICQANFGILMRYEDEMFHPTAMHNFPQALADYNRKQGPFRPAPGSRFTRVLQTKQVIHTADDAAEATPGLAARLGGARTIILVPMLKDEKLIGAILIYRQEVRPFADKQIALVQNFAAQAVIAIENARLLNELREALQQQTATAEVLKVISSSPGVLEPVFQAMLENAARMCEAKFGNLTLWEGDGFRVVAAHGAEAFVERRRRQPKLSIIEDPSTALAVLAKTKAVVHIADLTAEQAYINRSHPRIVELVEVAGARAFLAVPMLKEDELLGAIVIYRQEARPFSGKQISLVENFAAQAVIAIENTRLLNELRQSLEHQTSTSEVLSVISRSPTNTQPVFDAIAESAARLCDAVFTVVWLYDGDLLHYASSHNFTAEVLDQIKKAYPKRPDRSLAAGRAILDEKIAHVPDMLADPAYAHELAMAGNWRASVAVPMLRNGRSVGAISVGKAETGPFTERQMQLLTTFADQAVIAIENVRLFDEIQDKSRQLAEASQHKSQFLANMSHELRTPLNAILGYTELIADGIYGTLPEKTQAVLKRVESNGRHLLGLINAVLDLSKIEAGQFTLDLSDYSVQNVVQTVYNAVEPLALDKKLSFRADVQSEFPPGRGDERRLTQVLLNLVGNAIKFTDAGEVIIKAAAQNGDLHLSVRDTGPGISEADQAKLFQEFQQADNSTARKKEGTGLGLAISKHIVEMHGGRIWMESQIGQGSTFFVTLPAQVHEQAKPSSN